MTKRNEGWEERLDKLAVSAHNPLDMTNEEKQLCKELWGKGEVIRMIPTWQAKKIIQSEIKAERERVLEEMIKLSDLIEGQYTTEFNEWKAFKGFRNTMREYLTTE